jgi:hypothetical protein
MIVYIVCADNICRGLGYATYNIKKNISLVISEAIKDE